MLDAITGLFAVADRAEQERAIAREGQARLIWDRTYVDLFFMDTAFHESLAARVRPVSFGEAEISIISAEDLIVCKALFNRPHDWVDIERMVVLSGPELNFGYAERWVRFFVGDGHPVLDRLRRLCARD